MASTLYTHSIKPNMCVKPEKRTQNAFKSKIAENISNNRFQWFFFMHKFNGNVQCLTYSLSVSVSLSLYLCHSDSVYDQCMHYITLDLNNAVCIMPQLLIKNSLSSPFHPQVVHSFAFDSISLLLIIIFIIMCCFFGRFTLEFSLNFKLPVVE